MSPLLERERALDVLRDTLASAASGTGRIALVSGEAGIGKSTLVEHFLAAHAGGARVLRGACEALFTPQPLGPLHDVARDARGPLKARLAAPADTAALFAAMREELALPPLPVVLLMEDLHWADAATLDVLRHVGRRIESLPVLLVVTYRDDEIEAHPALRHVLGEWTSRAVVRLPLARLTPPAVASLAQERGVSDAGVFLATGGNPFFVTEVLANPGGRVPMTVRDAVLGRAASLTAGARDVLEFAAVVPRAAELWLLQTVLAPSLAAIDECVRSGLLVASHADLRFRHELARVAVEEAIAPLRARAWHARALAALAGAGGARSASLARLVHHARLAGDRAALARLGPQAADEAAARGARREAVAHCRAALEAGDLPRLERAALLDRYATHLFETDDLAGSIAARDEAIALYEAQGDAAATALALTSQAMTLVRALRNADADAASRRALALVADQGDARHVGRVFATETYLRMLARDYSDAVAWGEKARAVAQRHDDRETLAAVRTWTGAALMFVDFDRGLAMTREGLDMARGVADGGVRTADAYVMLGTALGELVRLPESVRYLDEGIAFAETRDLDRLGHYMQAWRSLVALLLGRWEDAERFARRVLADATQGSTHRVMALVALGRLQARRGDAASSALLDEALALAERSGTLQRIAPVRAARAEAAWLAGDAVQAGAEAYAAYALAVDKSHHWFVGELATWMHRAGRLRDIPALCAEPYAHALRGDWSRAAAAWAALGCPYEAALALAEGDADAKREALVAFDAMGAAPMAHRVRRSLREAGIAAVPRGPRATTRDHPAGLTTREAEVLELAGDGLSTPAIAARLFRSPRTVEHHLAAVLAKLGARTRAEAVETARRRGLLPPK